MKDHYMLRTRRLSALVKLLYSEPGGFNSGQAKTVCSDLKEFASA
jgi:hypothetical protein